MPSFGNCRILGVHGGAVASVRFSADGSHLFSACADGSLHRWALASDGPARTLARTRQFDDAQYRERVATVPLAMDARHGNLAVGLLHAAVDVYSAHTGQLLASLCNPAEGSAHDRDFQTVAFDPIDRDLVVASNGGYLTCWNVQQHAIEWRQSGFRGINSVAFLRGGSHLLAVEWDPWLHLWDWQTRKRVVLENPLQDSSYNLITARAAPAGLCVDFAISGTDGEGGNLFVGSIDRSELAWQMATSERVHDLVFTPDGRYLLTASGDGAVELWNLATDDDSLALKLPELPEIQPLLSGEHRQERGILYTRPVLLEGYDYPATTAHCIDLSPDGKLIAVGMVGGVVALIELQA